VRPKLLDIELKEFDAFRRQRVLEGLSILDLIGAYNDVQRFALTRPDQILLDIELCQIAHANRRHQQNLDSNGHLSPHCSSLEIPVPSGLAHQLIREPQQRKDVSPIIEMAQSRPISFREPTSTRCEAANDASHLIQMMGLDAHMMPRDRL